MNLDNALLKRQAISLFNFLGMKHENTKHIGELSIGDLMKLVEFFEEMRGVSNHD